MNMSEIASEHPCIPTPFEVTCFCRRSVVHGCVRVVFELSFNALVHVYPYAVEASTTLLAAFTSGF